MSNFLHMRSLYKAQRFLGCLATTAAVFSFPAVTLFVDHSDTVILLLLALLGIIVGITRGWWVNFGQTQRLAALVFLLYFLVSLTSYIFGIQTNTGFQMLGRQLRFLLLVPVMAAFIIYRPWRWALWAGSCAGAVIVGIYSAVQYVGHSDAGWAHGDTHHIVFGALSCLLAIFALVTGPRFSERGYRWPVLLARLAGLAGGLSGCVLSGARGTWILVAILPFTAVAFFPVGRRRVWLSAVLLAMVGFALIVYLPGLPLRAHVMKGISATHNYFAFYGQRQELRLREAPTCVTSPSTLKSMAQLLPHSKHVYISVVKVTANGNEKLKRVCVDPQLYALKFVALGGHNPWAAIPRSVVGGKVAKVFAKGNSSLVFWPIRSSTVRVSDKGFKLYVVHGAPRSGYRLTIGLHAGQEVEIVPVAKRRGEYLLAFSEDSVGTRLELWRAAIRVFMAHPLIGVGTGAWSVVANRLTYSGEFSPVIEKYEHPHQQFLAAAALRGTVGFLALLLLLMTAPFLAYKNQSVPREAIGGLVILFMGIALSGLTETMLVHSIVINWVVFFTAAFLSCRQFAFARRPPDVPQRDRTRM